MKVSIVIPTYNGATFIAETLASVFAQTFVDYEVVVSDDASSDETIQVVESFDDPRLRVLEDRSHQGPAGNWNRALGAASGEYVKLLAQDDLLFPSALQAQATALDGNSNAAFVAVQRDIIGVDGTVLMRGRGLSGLCGVNDQVTAARRIARTGANQFGEGAAVLFRRQASDETGWFDGSLPYAIDIDYWVRLLSWGPALGLCEPLAAFRVSSQSWSNSLLREQGRQAMALIERVAGDSDRGVTRRDVRIGKVRAQTSAVLRQAFYWKHRNHM